MAVHLCRSSPTTSLARRSRSEQVRFVATPPPTIRVRCSLSRPWVAEIALRNNEIKGAKNSSNHAFARYLSGRFVNTQLGIVEAFVTGP